MSNEGFLRPEVVNMLERKKRLEEQAQRINQLERNMLDEAKAVTIYLQAQDTKRRRFEENYLQDFYSLENQIKELRAQNESKILPISALSIAILALIVAFCW